MLSESGFSPLFLCKKSGLMDKELENKIYGVIIETLKSLGFDIVRLRMTDRGTAVSSIRILEILIERLDGSHVSIKDCKIASNNISALLDVEDIIPNQYNLEVSSAGIERPLVKLADFERFKDYIVQIKLHNAIEGAKKYQGKLLGVDNENISIEIQKPTSVINFEFANIKDAKIVLTEDLFRKIIKK